MSTEYKNQNSKGKLGARLCLSLFRKSSQWSDDSLTQGKVKGETNQFLLARGQARGQPRSRRLTLCIVLGIKHFHGLDTICHGGSIIIPHIYLFIFIHSIGTCRMRWSLAVLRSFFHSSLLCFLPPFSTNYSSILSHLILPSISWSTSQSCCSQIHI